MPAGRFHVRRAFPPAAGAAARPAMAGGGFVSTTKVLPSVISATGRPRLSMPLNSKVAGPLGVLGRMASLPAH